MNEKTFDFHGTQYTVSRCTAIASERLFILPGENDDDDYKEENRQEALLVSFTTDSGERSNYVVFGWKMPETDEDFIVMCEDTMAWDGYYKTLKTCRMID